MYFNFDKNIDLFLIFLKNQSKPKYRNVNNIYMVSDL